MEVPLCCSAGEYNPWEVDEEGCPHIFDRFEPDLPAKALYSVLHNHKAEAVTNSDSGM